MTIIEKSKSDFILEKGMEILWSKGYNGTSVNDIVKAAEIPKGSFYFYFKSKEDFAIKALQMYFKQVYIPATKILKDESISPKQRIIKFYEYRMSVLKHDLNCEKGCLACNLGNEVGEHSENIRKTVLRIHQQVVNEVVKTAKKAQKAGEIDASINVKNLIEFAEDAGKGAMISMKEMKSFKPMANVMWMIKNVLLK